MRYSSVRLTLTSALLSAISAFVLLGVVACGEAREDGDALESEAALAPDCDTDTAPPSIWCPFNSLSPDELPASVRPSAEDSCGLRSLAVTAYECWLSSANGERSARSACDVSLDGDRLTIFNGGGVKTRIEWTVEASDVAGNSIAVICSTLMTHRTRSR